MLVLGINTVAETCEAALVRDGVIVAELSEDMQTGHDARLAPVVEKMMRAAGVGFGDLDRAAVVVGPGSFTGVRVGVAFARGLALALDIPAVGVSSLEALDSLPGGNLLGVLVAKRRPPERTWWAQKLRQGRGVAAPVEAGESDLRDLVAGMDAVCGQLASVPDYGLARVETQPSAVAAALFAATASGDLPAPRPIYVRAPDAKPMDRT